MKCVAVILVLLGAILIGVGMSMRAKENVFSATKKGNKIWAAAVGATAGAVAGGVGAIGAGIGGVGIAACGTGVGIPAGAVCLVAASLCALIGGGIGYATGTPDKISTITVKAYSPYEYWTVIVVGCFLVSIGIFYLLRTMRNTEKAGEAFNK